MDFLSILLYSAINFVLIIIISYFIEKGKNLATKDAIAEITNKIETVKTEHQLRIEDLKKDLQISINEHQVKFSQLQIVRVNALTEFHKKFYSFQNELRIKFDSFSGMPENKNEMYWGVIKIIADFRDYFRENEILFSDKLNELILKAINEYYDVFMDARMSQSLDERSKITMSSKDINKSIELIEKGYDRFQKSIPEITNEIKKEIRELIGVS
jgi:hypothetical protein